MLLFVIFVGCNGVSSEENYEMTEDMNAEDLFDMISKADSFSVDVGDSQYQYKFVKGVGYSILEDYDNGGETSRVYELFMISDGIRYTIYTDGKTTTIKKRNVIEKDYQDVIDKYNEYVDYVKGTYASTTAGAEMTIAIDTSEQTANVKTIYGKGTGLLEIKQCKLYGINKTEVYVPRTYIRFKELAEDESLS